MNFIQMFNGYKTYIGVCLLAVAKALVDYSPDDPINEATMAIYVMNSLGAFLVGMGAAHKLDKIGAK
jgi:hypothetical protein